jgi:hypothetical protein
MQNHIFDEATAHNKRSGTARVKEKKEELVDAMGVLVLV